MKKIITPVLFICMSVLMFSCKKEEEVVTTPANPTLQIPATYESANYDAHIAEEKVIISQLKVLNAYMKKGTNVANTLALDSLNWYFASAGTPSLKSITAFYYQDRITRTNGWFSDLVTASGNTFDPATAPGTTGGVYGNRLLDKYGVETLEVIDKGLFASLLYNRIADLLLQNLNDSIIDKMVALYGASPAFPNTNNAANTPTPDAFIANYAARRDKNDGNGLYSRIKNSFLKLQASVRGGAQYNTERDQAIADLKINIEKAIVATVVNYGYAAIGKLSATNQDVTTKAGALHDLGEAVGFLHGFKAVYPSQRKITDAEIDQILTLLKFPPDGTPSTYLFITQGATELSKITEALDVIKGIYGFTSTEMEEFKQNWVSVQGR